MANQTCSKCVMDQSDVFINFDGAGVCNHCREAEQMLIKYESGEDGLNSAKLEQCLQPIKAVDKSRKYDCILGLSGGVDSSYIAYMAWQHGLRPLCVHFDNGWNAEVAAANIRRIVDTTGFDLDTYVVNWNEFRDLQRSFIKAGVIDVEMVTDHGIFANLVRTTRKHKIRYVLSGTNYRTEHGMPRSWIWPKMDLDNLMDIHRKFGTRKLKTFPRMHRLSWALFRGFGLGGVYVEPLNAITYKKNDAINELRDAFGWEPYGDKHFESVFTKFYQSQLLPEKFGVDKRRVHLSALIRTGELTRDEAFKELEKPIISAVDRKLNRQYVLKKLGFSEEEFDAIMTRRPVPHSHYKTDAAYVAPLEKLYASYAAFRTPKVSPRT